MGEAGNPLGAGGSEPGAGNEVGAGRVGGFEPPGRDAHTTGAGGVAADVEGAGREIGFGNDVGEGGNNAGGAGAAGRSVGAGTAAGTDA